MDSGTPSSCRRRRVSVGELKVEGDGAGGDAQVVKGKEVQIEVRAEDQEAIKKSLSRALEKVEGDVLRERLEVGKRGSSCEVDVKMLD